jgi:hypothetical protein
MQPIIIDKIFRLSLTIYVYDRHRIISPTSSLMFRIGLDRIKKGPRNEPIDPKRFLKRRMTEDDSTLIAFEAGK